MSKRSRNDEERERLAGGLACECGRTVNLVRQQDGSYRCTACLLAAEEQERRGFTVS